MLRKHTPACERMRPTQPCFPGAEVHSRVWTACILKKASSQRWLKERARQFQRLHRSAVRLFQSPLRTVMTTGVLLNLQGLSEERPTKFTSTNSRTITKTSLIPRSDSWHQGARMETG